MTSVPMPTVAIGVPCYNRPELLDQALTSLRNQTYPDISILVSDNASPNPIVTEIAGRHAAADPRVRYVRQAVNIGGSKNFEYVLVNSTAPYFMWASDDDWYEPTFVARCVDLLDREGQNLVSAFTEVQFESELGSDKYFDMGEAFRTFRSDSRAERLQHMSRHIYGHLIYAVHRREALFHNERPVTDWFGTYSDEWPILFLIALKGNLATTPGADFHKRSGAYLNSLAKWRAQGGLYPRRKLYHALTRPAKQATRLLYIYLELRDLITSMNLKDEEKKRVLLSLRRSIFGEALSKTTGWRTKPK